MRTRLCALVVAGLLPALAAPAGAAPPAPFGHPCVSRAGALHCRTASDAARVPSFDGVPLDVDVWLPAQGDGPFATIAMLHGFGGSKTSTQRTRSQPTYNAAYFARNGYAVVSPSARGFGRSCGVPASRTAGCERGWMHLADQRYEVRDVQHLLGLLVDQGVADRRALGVTGISYGGGQSATLALLRNRVRLPGGALAPWRSPAGRALRIGAAYARWPWSDLADALLPNGRLGAGTYASPVGVAIQSYNDGLFALAKLTGFVAPARVDPTADLATWKQRTDRGEPYGRSVRATLRELHRFHSPAGVTPAPGGPAPLLLQAGWTDDLFPAGQALRLYDELRDDAPRAPVALQLGDLGHDRGANHRLDIAALEREGLRFLDAALRDRGRAERPGAVVAYLQRCPKAAARGGGPARAASYAQLARGEVVLEAQDAQRVLSSGGDSAVAEKLDPQGLDACTTLEDEVVRGTAVAQRPSDGFTLLGRTEVRARVRVRGSGAQLVGRLWDVHRGRRRLIDRGVLRVASGARTIRFALNGNGWRFEAGHDVRLELVGRDAPAYRPSNGAFSVELSALAVALPTLEPTPAPAP